MTRLFVLLAFWGGCAMFQALRGQNITAPISVENYPSNRIPSNGDTLTMQCRYEDEPLTLTLAFDFDDDSTIVSVYRDWRLMERNVHKVFPDYEITIDIAQYGEGAYVIYATPRNQNKSLMVVFGYDGEPINDLKVELPDVDPTVDDRPYGERIWHTDYTVQGNQMVALATNEPYVGGFWNQIRKEAVILKQSHSRSFAGLCFPDDEFSWFNCKDVGLHVWWEGNAAICGLSKGNILEFVYSSDSYDESGVGKARLYSTDHTLNSSDDGAAKKEILMTRPTRDTFGYAVYEMLEDGNVGFGMNNSGAIREINIYAKDDQSSLQKVKPEIPSCSVPVDLNGRTVGMWAKGICIYNGKKILR